MDDEPRTGEAVTANYGWVKPTVGASDDAWGGYINADLDGIDSTVHGIATGNITGTSTNDNAAVGYVGEVISSNVTTGVSLTNGVAANITNISLTAGDWDVCGEVWVSIGTGTSTGVIGAINSVSATLPVTSAIGTARTTINTTLNASAMDVVPLRSCRISLAATTVYYLVVYVGFGSGTVTATGNIWARRAR